MIPVEDGVSLAAEVYTPKAKGRYPAILVFSACSNTLPYGVESYVELRRVPAQAE
jgi:predicted acyl esterase